MKKFAQNFLPSLLFSFFLIALLVGGYIVGLLLVAKPGFMLTAKPTHLNSEEQHKVVAALIQLSHITSIFQLDKYTALFIGSAGGISAGFQDDTAQLSAKYFVLRAVDISRSYGEREQNFDPFYDASINAAFALKELGDAVKASQIASEALDLATEKSPKSYQIANLKKVVGFLEKNH